MRTEVLKRFLREVDLFQKEEEAACHFTKNSKREDEHALGSALENVSGRPFFCTLPELVHILLVAARASLLEAEVKAELMCDHPRKRSKA